MGDAFDIAWKANRRNYALLTGTCTATPAHVEGLGLSRLADRRRCSFVIFAMLILVRNGLIALAYGRDMSTFAGLLIRRAISLRYNQLGSRGVAQPGSASALGAEGRGFESLRPDHQINHLARSAHPLEQSTVANNVAGGCRFASLPTGTLADRSCYKALA